MKLSYLWIMKRLLTSLFLISLPSITLAESITFYDLNWDMTVEQMNEKLTSKGYKCSPPEGYPKVQNCWSSRNIEDHIGITEIAIYFGCGAYNGCNYSLEEVYLAMSKRYGKVDRQVLMYKWYSSIGDSLSLMDMRNIEPYLGPHQVVLFRGRYRDKLDF